MNKLPLNVMSSPFLRLFEQRLDGYLSQRIKLWIEAEQAVLKPI
jgi:hypothetical protein